MNETIQVAESGQNQLLQRVEKALSKTILSDREGKLICFLSMLSTYTDSPFHCAFISESSTGKSHIALEIAKFFQVGDVLKCDYTSPTALFHGVGEFTDEGVRRVCWSRKIVIFKDQPHSQVLELLKSVMSADEASATIRITDRPKRGPLRALETIIDGTPAFIFCSASANLREETQTRVFQLSAGDEPDKISKVLELQNRIASDPVQWENELATDEDRRWLQDHIHKLSSADHMPIMIPQDLKVLENFLQKSKSLIPRSQRDYPRLNALTKAICFLNREEREVRQVGASNVLVANQSDVNEALKLYGGILRANELGLAPSQLDFYDRVLIPLWDSGVSPGYNEIAQEFFKVFRRPLSYRRWHNSVKPAFLNTGLIAEDRDPTNLRRVICVPVAKVNGQLKLEGEK